MKCSAFLIFTLLIIFIPKYETLKILKKIKDFLHPTTTTAASPVVPGYETERELHGTSTGTWKGKGQDVWETTTSGTNIHSSFSDKTSQQERDYISITSTTTKPSNSFVEGDKDSSTGSITPTNDAGPPPETPGINIPTIDNIYNNNFKAKQPSTYENINQFGVPTTRPTITENTYNKLQPDAPQPVSNPAGNQGQTSNQLQPGIGSQPNQLQPIPTPAGNQGPSSNQLQPDYYNQQEPQVPSSAGNQRNPTSQLQPPGYGSQQRPPQVPPPAGNSGKPTTQLQPDYNQHNQDGSGIDDIVFPDESSVGPSSPPGTISGDSGQWVASTTERPSGTVPVGEDGGRRVINAPVKDCGKGKKLDDKGNCRKIARK